MSGLINNQKIPFKAILIGIAAAIAGTLIVMFAIGFVMTVSSAVPYSAAPYLLLIADAVGVFIGAYCCAAINRSKGLILGATTGFILFVIFFIAGLAAGDSITLVTLLRFFVLLSCGALGGIKGVNRKEKLRIK